MNVGPFMLAVMGPTASGKSALAEELADKFDAQLINADAFQVYRGMDIGTAKPTNKDRYHLLDIKSPNESFSSGEFCLTCLPILEDLYEHGKNAIVVGGTGLYIRALFESYDGLAPAPDPALREQINARYASEGLDSLVSELVSSNPTAAEKIDLKNPARVKRALERTYDKTPPIPFHLPPFRRLKVGINVDSALLVPRIHQRTRNMMHNGWVEETQDLLTQGYGPSDPGFRAIGYQAIVEYLRQQTDLEQAVATTIVDTERYAKRQRTWLRSEPDLIMLDSQEGLLPRAMNILGDCLQ